jgi:hypothetical protein
MEQLSYLDDQFDNPALKWVETQVNEHFWQRHLDDAKIIVCETVMTVHGTTDQQPAIDLIGGPWDWWEHGRITDFVRNADGSSDQILSPVWWFITRVGLHIQPPVDLVGLRGKRMGLMLSGHFAGPSSMDVYLNERGDGMIIRGRFHGVEYTMPAIPNMIAEGLHLGAEAGTMPIPFPKGTGWVGLLHKLEAGVHEQEVLTT